MLPTGVCEADLAQHMVSLFQSICTVELFSLDIFIKYFSAKVHEPGEDK